MIGDPRLPPRFWAKVQPDPEAECWLWTAGLYPSGYGQFRVGSVTDGTRRRVSAHRFAYEALVETVKEGLDMDHLCRVRSCCNPKHLEPVTRRENLLRGETIPSRNAGKTHCSHGHPFDAKNTRINKDGSRTCRRCVVRYVTERRRRLRAERESCKPARPPVESIVFRTGVGQ
jgi:hypothetical protein